MNPLLRLRGLTAKRRRWLGEDLPNRTRVTRSCPHVRVVVGAHSLSHNEHVDMYEGVHVARCRLIMLFRSQLSVTLITTQQAYIVDLRHYGQEVGSVPAPRRG